ncbi:MocR-like pyridoxine biosynthesis transcription factor PdxR [Actinoalloteichus hymeniacidonis]|uniref:Transcriptional regulator with HTH domain and aminotransferase domain n=1 Tax=Actinoalloteichus hymeniacidonis TaxID=340345 RepID=A0AAC9HUP3_9PSEU|nr:PLP-dependent aminotransferase family protein [Actinoalloteichus hymeniacidonis]AOS65301.1 transcriptional regulator with HTH domain and aminotransferase domain [Actinoalloteichus hymeniacidonis]MBB5906614.1 GntR family transcriptional regulator/MocR family aminotransferase [Actinoalloteichus hymeniacidonis]
MISSRARGGPVAEIPVDLDRTSAIPLAVQLADAFRAAAGSGVLRAGDRLPSTRSLASSLRVSRTVTAAAYEQLHAEGWIVGRHGSGTFVTTSPPGAAQRGEPSARPPERDRPQLDMTPGAPWVHGLDRAAWRRAWRVAADAPPLVRPQRAGLPDYRAAIVEHLLRHRGLSVRRSDEHSSPVEAVLATAGSTAAVAELASSVFRPGDRVAVEDPGYQRAVGAFRAAGIEVVPAPVDTEGLLVEEIPDGVRAVYCSPAHQYPLGGRLPAERRVALIRLARQRDFLVIEDDYDGELRFDVAPLPLLAVLGPDVVVHLGTTSKILTPTLGTGWMVAPRRVLDAVQNYRDLGGSGPPAAGQRVFVELARHGDLGRHLRRMRRELASRRLRVVRALGERGIEVLGDEAGAHVVIPLTSVEAEQRVAAEAAEAGLLIDGLARHYQQTPLRFGVPLGYAACSTSELDRALPMIVDLFVREQARTGG